MSELGRQTSTRGSTRVVVVDDHDFFRDGLIRGLRNSGYFEVVGEAGDWSRRSAADPRRGPDVAVLDYQDARADGLEVVRAIVRILPTRTPMLSAITDSAVVFEAIQGGANGYLSKESRRAEIIDAVQQAARGGRSCRRSSPVVWRTRSGWAQRGPVLSEREQQVLRGSAQGKSIPELAAELTWARARSRPICSVVREARGVRPRGGGGRGDAPRPVGVRWGLFQ